MAAGRRSILVDARVNSIPGAHGLARSVMKLAAHMEQPDEGLKLRVLIHHGRPQIFPLSELPGHAEVIGTDITYGAVHRCHELARLIRAVGASVLYVPYPPFTPLIRPCPFVVTIHDCTLERDRGWAGNGLRQAGMRLVTRTALRRAVATTAPSQASLAEIRQLYPGAPNPTLVPNGVDLGQFRDRGSAAVAMARARYQLPDRFVLTVGAHRPHKNHEILVRALAVLPARVSLVIVGYLDPHFHSPLPRLIGELGLSERVRLIPDVAEEYLPAVYRAAAAFAFPSLSEGFGMPVLEAMAAGVPVVMSRIQALAEVAGSAAMTVSPLDVAGWASALMTVLSDRALRDRLSGAGLAVAAEASWEHGAATLGQLLSAVGSGRMTRTSRPPERPRVVSR